MRPRERRTGWRTSRQLVLLAGVVVVAATACGSVATTGSTDPLTGQDTRAAVASSPQAADTPVPTFATALTTPRATTGPPAPGPSTATGPTTTGPTGAAAPTDATPMGAATPVRLRIPAIGVDSDLVGLGLQEDGTLEVPPAGFPAGWYRGAPTPGELGPAIIAGHVDWGGRPGVFIDLGTLSPGDEIAVVRADGRTARFHVDRVERFAKDQFPTRQVYADLDHAGLRLITCGGDFDRSARSYVDNVVVFARLVGQGDQR